MIAYARAERPRRFLESNREARDDTLGFTGIELETVDAAVGRDVCKTVALRAAQPPITGFSSVSTDRVSADKGPIAHSVFLDDALICKELVLRPFFTQDIDAVGIHRGSLGVVCNAR